MRRISSIATVFALLVALLAVADTAAADDYHVTLTGSDINGNGSAARPWRTITFALGSMPAATSTNTHTLRVGPGLWLSGGGEVFPLNLPQGVTLAGAGAGVTVIAGTAPDGRSGGMTPSAVLVYIQTGSTGWATNIGPTGVRDMSLIHARIGIEMIGTGQAVPDPQIYNVTFWQDQTGVQAIQAAPTIEKCVFDTGTMGIAATRSTQKGPEFVVRDSVFRFNIHGINASNTVKLRVKGNRFEHNGTGALLGTLGPKAIMTPLFCNNVYYRNGFGLTTTALYSSQTLPTLCHETFAFNNTGIASMDNSSTASRSDPVIRNCIIWSSVHVDVSGVERDEIRNCALRTATAANSLPKVGLNGIRGEDPLFVDAQNGDLRLTDASPMIDRGRADYLGAPVWDRDGDVREIGFPDLGADEFAGFLRRDGTAATPGNLVLRLTARADVGYTYIMLASYRSGGPASIAIGVRRLPLHPDLLFFGTLQMVTYMPSFVGIINAQGRATVNVPVPRFSMPMSHVVHFAFVTLHHGAPYTVKTISNALPAELTMP